MRRRVVLAGGLGLFSGCGLAPSPPTTEGFGRAAPTFLGRCRWSAAASGYEITFERGNRFTRENTTTLTVVSANAETVWATTRSEPAESSFPIAPGDSVLHPATRGESVRLKWYDANVPNTVTVAMWDADSRSRTTGTVEE